MCWRCERLEKGSGSAASACESVPLHNWAKGERVANTPTPRGRRRRLICQIEFTPHKQAEESGLRLSSSSSRRTEPNNPTSLAVKQATHSFISLLVWWRSGAALVHALFFHASVHLQSEKKGKKLIAIEQPNILLLWFEWRRRENSTKTRHEVRGKTRALVLLCFVVLIRFRLIIAASSC